MLFELTTLPATHKTSAEKLAALLGSEAARLDGIVLEEGVEFGNKLEEVAEGEEAAIQGPRRTNDRSVGCEVNVLLTAAEDDTLADGLLARVGLRVKALNRRLGDAIEETKASKR